MEYGYYPLSTVDMEGFLEDENKFSQLPWEDTKYVSAMDTGVI